MMTTTMTNQQRAAMQMALAELEYAHSYGLDCVEAITALRGALNTRSSSTHSDAEYSEVAQPQGEPVAWIHRYKTGAEQINTAPPETYVGWSHTPLYTTPPVVSQGSWVDLTDDEIINSCINATSRTSLINWKYVYAIIAAFKEKQL